MGVDIVFSQHMLIPKTKSKWEKFPKDHGWGRMNQSLGYWYLFAKKEWWQANSASSYLQQHYQVLCVAGRDAAFNCLKGWDPSCGADQSRGCVEFEELFGYLWLSFWSNLGCLKSVVFVWSHCDYGTAVWVRSHWEQQQKLQPCHNLPGWRDDIIQEQPSLLLIPQPVSQGFYNFWRGCKNFSPISLWGGYGFLAEVKAVGSVFIFSHVPNTKSIAALVSLQSCRRSLFTLGQNQEKKPHWTLNFENNGQS